MTDLDHFARTAYANGTHPVDHAQMRLQCAFELYAEAPTLPPDVMAAVVLAELLKAGWHPPGEIFPDYPPDFDDTPGERP